LLKSKWSIVNGIHGNFPSQHCLKVKQGPLLKIDNWPGPSRGLFLRVAKPGTFLTIECEITLEGRKSMSEGSNNFCLKRKMDCLKELIMER